MVRRRVFPVIGTRCRCGSATRLRRRLQIDVWGEVLDTLHLADRAGLPRSEHGDSARWPLVEHLAGIWDQAGVEFVGIAR